MSHSRTNYRRIRCRGAEASNLSCFGKRGSGTCDVAVLIFLFGGRVSISGGKDGGLFRSSFKAGASASEIWKSVQGAGGGDAKGGGMLGQWWLHESCNSQRFWDFVRADGFRTPEPRRPQRAGALLTLVPYLLFLITIQVSCKQ